MYPTNVMSNFNNILNEQKQILSEISNHHPKFPRTIFETLDDWLSSFYSGIGGLSKILSAISTRVYILEVTKMLLKKSKAVKKVT